MIWIINQFFSRFEGLDHHVYAERDIPTQEVPPITVSVEKDQSEPK